MYSHAPDRFKGEWETLRNQQPRQQISQYIKSQFFTDSRSSWALASAKREEDTNTSSRDGKIMRNAL